MASSVDDKKFAQMTVGEKLVCTVKVIIFLCTFGFAFPTVLHDDDYVRKFHG